MAQVAEGALAEVGNILQRIRELAVQSANDTNSSSDRQALNNEVSQLVGEVQRIALSTNFNGRGVLDGSLEDLVFQVGANKGQTISIDGVDTRANKLGTRVEQGADITIGNLTSAVNINNMVVNGFAIDLSNVDVTSDNAMNDVVQAINNGYLNTNVEAVLKTSINVDMDYVSQATAYTAVINDVSIDVAAGATAENFAAAVNAKTNQHGITATWDGATNGMIFTSDNQDFEYDLGAGGAALVFANYLADDGTTAITNGTNTTGGAADTIFRGIELFGAVGEDIITTSVADDTNDYLQLESTITSAVTQTNDYRLIEADILTRDSASQALRTMDYALQQVNGTRAELGAIQNRFMSTIANISTGIENLSAARSRIQDADFAVETAELTRTQILQQAGVAMLAQANSLPQNVLSLLQ
jgi:flagellin